ncbi:MAG: heavy-metal-associated domain-containing protein [Pseudomonadales bacterium]|nr:heavy-metal-associated domain-containing protein [Pseudomonadales bacterium]
MRHLLSIFILLLLSLPASSKELYYTLRVDGLVCAYCAFGIEKNIKSLNGVVKESVEIRLNEGLVSFEANVDNPIEPARLRQLINNAGFTLRSFKTQPVIKENTNHE